MRDDARSPRTSESDGIAHDHDRDGTRCSRTRCGVRRRVAEPRPGGSSRSRAPLCGRELEATPHGHASPPGAPASGLRPASPLSRRLLQRTGSLGLAHSARPATATPVAHRDGRSQRAGAAPACSVLPPLPRPSVPRAAPAQPAPRASCGALWRPSPQPHREALRQADLVELLEIVDRRSRALLEQGAG